MSSPKSGAREWFSHSLSSLPRSPSPSLRLCTISPTAQHHSGTVLSQVDALHSALLVPRLPLALPATMFLPSFPPLPSPSASASASTAANASHRSATVHERMLHSAPTTGRAIL